ncbi:hypothetical protein F2Q70_00030269 [Brassica cretica]|uniref:Uncharacterized protein n=1 Tax=Brassica cretica TaxID=69181 RepID=A0A8S9FDV2_BRACR|nr:hypothetical protein F2Q70_00030269 [Brassica cretica]
MHQAWETTRENPDLSSEVQSLKEKLDEHSKQLEQSAEKLSQVQSVNTVLRDQNQALKMAGNKKRPGATREETENPQIHDLEESVSEPEPEKEAPEKTAAESSITSYLEQIFSRRFDAMQSTVECLLGLAPSIRRSNPDS